MASSTTPFNIQPWMWSSLQGLSNTGALYGVPPQVMAAELRSQNGVPGDGVSYPVAPNSSGYGFLGLGANTYDTPSGPQQVTPELLNGNSGEGFATLASIAAGRIATLSTGGNLQQGIITYDGSPSWTMSPGGTIGLLQGAGYTVPTSGFSPTTGSPGEKLAQSPSAQGSTQSGLGPISPSNPNGLLNPGLVTETSSGQKWFGLSLGSTWSKVLGYGIAVAGGLTMIVGILVMVKSETGINALAKALQPARSAPAPSASTVTAPVESAAPAAPQVPEMAPDDTDEALADYYAGVAAGLDRANNPPRRPSRAGGQVVPTGGRVVDADEDDFDYDPPDLLAS